MNKQQKLKKLNPYLFNNQSLPISVQQYKYPLQILDIQRDFDFLAANEKLQLMRTQIDQELTNLTKIEFNPDNDDDLEKHINDFRQHIKSISYKAFWPFYDTALLSKSFSQFYKLTRGSYQQLQRVEILLPKKDDHGSINIIARFLEKLFEFKKEYIKLSIEGFFFLLIGLYGPAYFHSVYDGVFTLIDITKHYFRDDNLLVLKDQYKDMDLYMVQQVLWIYKQIQKNSNKQTVIQRSDIINLIAVKLNIIVDDISEEFKRQGNFWNYKTDFYEFIKAPEKLMNSIYKFLYGTDISTVIVQVILECLVILLTKCIQESFVLDKLNEIQSDDIICEIVYTRPLFEYYTKIIINSSRYCLQNSLDDIQLKQINQLKVDYTNIGSVFVNPPRSQRKINKPKQIDIIDMPEPISEYPYYTKEEEEQYHWEQLEEKLLILFIQIRGAKFKYLDDLSVDIERIINWAVKSDDPITMQISKYKNYNFEYNQYWREIEDQGGDDQYFYETFITHIVSKVYKSRYNRFLNKFEEDYATLIAEITQIIEKINHKSVKFSQKQFQELIVPNEDDLERHWQTVEQSFREIMNILREKQDTIDIREYYDQMDTICRTFAQRFTNFFKDIFERDLPYIIDCPKDIPEDEDEDEDEDEYEDEDEDEDDDDDDDEYDEQLAKEYQKYQKEMKQTVGDDYEDEIS